MFGRRRGLFWLLRRGVWGRLGFWWWWTFLGVLGWGWVGFVVVFLVGGFCLLGWGRWGLTTAVYY